MRNIHFIRTVVCLAALFVGPHVANAADWILIASTKTMDWEGRGGSLHPSENNSGQPISVASGRVTNKSTSEIKFEQWYVRVSDCKRGVGKVVTADIDGNFLYDTDFVLKGGSVASSLADMLCYSYIESARKGLSS